MQSESLRFDIRGIDYRYVSILSKRTQYIYINSYLTSPIKKIQDDWKTNLFELRKLREFVNNKTFLQSLYQVKQVQYHFHFSKSLIPKQ